jgi:RNA polymerase sigma-70 factor (ECF subfamily)
MIVVEEAPASGFGDDDVLVTALRGGDEAAFAWLLDRYDRSLRRLARTFVATPAAADEVVQETWLAVVEGIDRFEGRASLRTWVSRILVNKARTRGVRDKRSVPFSSIAPGVGPGAGAGGGNGDGLGPTFPPERFLPEDHPRWPGHWADPPTPWDAVPQDRLEARETLAHIRAAIEALPQPHRTVITLRDVEGWSSDEVCAVLDLTPANQRVVLHRARARVRTALETYLTEVTV